MPSTVQLLKHEIATNFSVYLAERGFEFDGHQNDFYLYRRRGENHHDLVEIQIDKYHRPKFVLNFGRVEANGIVDAYGQHLPARKAQTHHLPVNGRLYRWPYTRFWFRINTYWGMVPDVSAIRAEISRMERVFQQVEKWFVSDTIGPNLAVSHNPENEPGVRIKAAT